MRQGISMLHGPSQPMNGTLPCALHAIIVARMKRRTPTSPSPALSAFPVQHISRTGKTYYLVQRPSKTGRPAYTFTTSPRGQPVDAVPEGYDVYENAAAQVFL